MSAACLETSDPAMPIATPETHTTSRVNVLKSFAIQHILVEYSVTLQILFQHLQGLPISPSS
jgi:hypothetical protein